MIKTYGEAVWSLQEELIANSSEDHAAICTHDMPCVSETMNVRELELREYLVNAWFRKFQLALW